MTEFSIAHSVCPQKRDIQAPVFVLEERLAIPTHDAPHARLLVYACPACGTRIMIREMRGGDR